MAWASCVHAQDTLIDEFADAIAESLAPRWAGPRVPWPDPRPRPPSAGVLRSRWAPVAVHPSTATRPERAESALMALEDAHEWLAAHRWPLPISDGGYGGTTEFDLYLDDTAGGLGEPVIELGIDAPRTWEGLDGASVFAIVRDAERFEPAVISAYVQATLLSEDPAEAPAWRAATGDFVAWQLTGSLGESDRGLVARQREAFRGWIDHEPASGHGGAVFLAMLSSRNDNGTGNFVRDLWSGARQLTWEGDGLRATPDLWQVLASVQSVADDPLLRLIEDFGVERYFTGAPDRRRYASYPILGELPPEAAVPLTGSTSWGRLPRRFEPRGLEVEAWGSAYYAIDVSSAPVGSTLRIWLRAEYGVGWALTAVRLDQNGRDIGRVRAPVRPRTPQSFIPLELTDARTHRVLVVVTNLGDRLVDADEEDGQARSFRLVIDRVEPDGAVPREPR